MAQGSDKNFVNLIGNLGDTPALRYTKSGNAVTNLSVATNRSYRDSDGNSHEITKWHRITVWGKQAEVCCEYLQKGNKVEIEGHLEDNVWEGKDGTKHRDYRVQASNVRFLDRATRSEQQVEEPSAPAAE